MPDTYHAPTLALTALLLPAFAYLYHRFRDIRTLLWLSGFFSQITALILLYSFGPKDPVEPTQHWLAAAGQSSILLASALFLGSLSPSSFRVGNRRILYVVPYIVPLVLCSILYFGVWHGNASSLPRMILLLALSACSFAAVIMWTTTRLIVPWPIGTILTGFLGVVGFFTFFALGPPWALTFDQAFNYLMTAFLLVFVFRRISPGLVLSVLGFLAYALVAVRAFPLFRDNPALDSHLVQIIAMSKVVAAIGMILLTLEDQLSLNKAAEQRERRARRELEAYTRMILTRRRLEDFDRQGDEICEAVAEHSRFSKAALLLRRAGGYCLAGAAGLDRAVIKALLELAGRLPADEFLTLGTLPAAIEDSQTVHLDLTPWLGPGDDLKHLGFTSVLAVPLVSRSVTEGALLLSGMRPDPNARAKSDLMRRDDLLPIEMLVARLQATRSQTIMLEKLIDAEKFGHLGQLAANVTQQLSNPMTVILGYASMLEGTASLESADRKAVQSILSEARRMRSTIESLTRMARPHSDQLAAISVTELLSDLAEFYRPNFLQRSIEFRLNLAPNLPRVVCSPQQLRQAVRHSLQFAMEAAESGANAGAETRAVSLEACSDGPLVQITIAHSGPGFQNPERAFDPFMPAPAGVQFGPLGLSLCATVMRDNNGRASAVNFNGSGAAIIFELKPA